jgi:cytidine deaminase
MSEMTWEDLRQAAAAAAGRAYAPYSGYPVGAAAVADDGRLVTGCNVENASLGLTLCAECGLVSALALSGGGRLTRFTCVDRAGQVITPCGRCRQLLLEHGGPTLALLAPGGVTTLAELLPEAWGPDNLTRKWGTTPPPPRSPDFPSASESPPGTGELSR